MYVCMDVFDIDILINIKYILTKIHLYKLVAFWYINTNIILWQISF